MAAFLRSRFPIVLGLRARLTLSYLVFFAVLLAFLGFFFTQTLLSVYDTQTRAVLNDEWTTLKSYLKIEKGKPVWFYDRHDPEEAYIVERLRRIYLLAGADGKPLEVSKLYAELGVEPPEVIRQRIAELRRHPREPVWEIRHNHQKVPFILRSGLLVDEGKVFYLAIGRSLAESHRVVGEFQRNYALFMPLMIAAGILLGWVVSGRALRPLNEIATTAERITGSNLTAHIPLRGTHDELDRLIESFNRMIERLDSAFTQMRQFSTDVSHELRTPLTAIRGQLEVAMFTAQTPEQYREAIMNALEDVERLSRTVRALLLLSQAESGQLALQMQTLDLSQAVREILEQFEIAAEASKLRLTSSLEPDALITADRVQMERLISNLVSNAIKYTPEGGLVHVAVRRDSTEVCLEVEDTGEGIPAEHLPHIFDRFYRVPKRESTPERGLGLGLSFVAWIVRAHHGRIEVDSSVGQGSRFRVWLPAAPPQPAVAAESALAAR